MPTLRSWLTPAVLGFLFVTACGGRDRASPPAPPSAAEFPAPVETSPSDRARAAEPERVAAPPLVPAGGSDAILLVQRRLVDRGFAPGYPDGRLGPDTIAALRDFQREQGLPPTGRLDADTLEALFGGAPEIQPVRGFDPVTAPGSDADTPLAAAFGLGLALGFLGAVVLALVARQARRVRA